MISALFGSIILGQRLAQQFGADATIAISTLITAASIAMTVVLLIVSLWRGRKSSRVRPLLDVLRVIVQIAVATAVPLITGVAAVPPIVGGAVLMGLAAGVMQAQLLTVEVDGDRVSARRSIAGLSVWGAGLVLMQAAGLANRTGLLEVGQGITWFSIGVSAGLAAGRHASVVQAVRVAAVAAGAIALVGGVAAATLVAEAPPAEAQGCPPGFEQGYFDEETQSQVDTSASYPTQCSKWVNGRQGTYQIFRSGCDLGDEWTAKTGQSASNPVYGQNPGLGYALYDNMIVRIQTVPASNGLDLEPAAAEYARWFGGSCAAVPAPVPTAQVNPTAAPTATVEQQGNADQPAVPAPNDPAQSDTPAPAVAPTLTAPSAPSAPTATPRVLVEQLDPDAVPESREIEDEGGSLFPTTTPEPASEETQATTTQPDAADHDVDEQGLPAASDEPEPVPTPDSGSGTTEDGPDPEMSEQDAARVLEDLLDDEDVSENEALATALAGLAAAAGVGIITFADAAGAAQELVDAAARNRAEEARRSAATDPGGPLVPEPAPVVPVAVEPEPQPPPPEPVPMPEPDPEPPAAPVAVVPESHAGSESRSGNRNPPRDPCAAIAGRFDDAARTWRTLELEAASLRSQYHALELQWQQDRMNGFFDAGWSLGGFVVAGLTTSAPTPGMLSALKGTIGKTLKQTVQKELVRRLALGEAAGPIDMELIINQAAHDTLGTNQTTGDAKITSGMVETFVTHSATSLAAAWQHFDYKQYMESLGAAVSSTDPAVQAALDAAGHEMFFQKVAASFDGIWSSGKMVADTNVWADGVAKREKLLYEKGLVRDRLDHLNYDLDEAERAMRSLRGHLKTCRVEFS